VLTSAARVHCVVAATSQVGINGYYPLTDRRLDYWLQIGTSLGGGAAITSVMQILLKPASDAAVLASRTTDPWA
jgi:hypothetical protein